MYLSVAAFFSVVIIGTASSLRRVIVIIIVMSLRNAEDSQFLRPRCEQTTAYQKSEVGLLPFEPNVCGMCSTHFELFVVVLFLCIPDCGYYFKITTFIVKCSD